MLPKNIKITGDTPTGYDSVFLFIPQSKEVICVSEGTGDNLLPEDTEKGYVDYIYYEYWDMEDTLEEAGGGQVMLKTAFREAFACTADAIPAVLDMEYGDKTIPCFILS